MILVDDALLADISRKNKKAAAMVSKTGLDRELDSGLSDLFSKGVNKNSFLKELSKFSEQSEDEDLL